MPWRIADEVAEPLAGFSLRGRRKVQKVREVRNVREVQKVREVREVVAH